ncbi:MAG TPA: flagellar hook-length control protein FliK [Clostridiaceae bacterium]|nr:flagellar hook-length control protein FliK [Clostridiaceae bacterium]
MDTSECSNFLSLYQNIQSSPSDQNPECEERTNNIDCETKSLMPVSHLQEYPVHLLERLISANEALLNPDQENILLTGEPIQSSSIPDFIDLMNINGDENKTSGEESLFQLQINSELLTATEEESNKTNNSESGHEDSIEADFDINLAANTIAYKNTDLGQGEITIVSDASNNKTDINEDLDTALNNEQVNKTEDLHSDAKEIKSELKRESNEDTEHQDGSIDNDFSILQSLENKPEQPEYYQEFSVHNNDELENREIRLSKSDGQNILKQVIDKAKVFIDGEKSEMVIELKPESLGKLSLKVVSEKGMVEANFVAENTQVKEILETNMNLLKDVLEKQGLVVQNFSVSVGDHSAGSFGRDDKTSREKGKVNIASVYTDIGEFTVTDYQQVDRIIDIYKINGRKIDLTA